MTLWFDVEPWWSPNSSGRMVRVEEIASLPHQLRVRARLAHPPGWITLVNMETGRPCPSAIFRENFGPFFGEMGACFLGKSRNVEGRTMLKPGEEVFWIFTLFTQLGSCTCGDTQIPVSIYFRYKYWSSSGTLIQCWTERWWVFTRSYKTRQWRVGHFTVMIQNFLGFPRRLQ